MHVKTKDVKFRQDVDPHESTVQQVIEIGTGEVEVAYCRAALSSVAIGSCIAVAALDSKKGVVLCHY